MSIEELKRYRLTSLEDPSDEMLAMIMAEVAKEVKKSTARTEKIVREMVLKEIAARRTPQK